MRVYSLKTDIEHYKYFLPDTEDEAELAALEMDCTRKADTWRPPPVFIPAAAHQESDFLQYGTDTLIMSPRATEILIDALEVSGELLPLPYKGVEYTVFNCTNCLNVLDEESTEWKLDPDDGERVGIKRFAFHARRFSDRPLFKIPELGFVDVLLAEWPEWGEPQFRPLVEEHGLKGLVFRELWNDEGREVEGDPAF